MPYRQSSPRTLERPLPAWLGTDIPWQVVVPSLLHLFLPSSGTDIPFQVVVPEVPLQLIFNYRIFSHFLLFGLIRGEGSIIRSEDFNLDREVRLHDHDDV